MRSMFLRPLRFSSARRWRFLALGAWLAAALLLVLAEPAAGDAPPARTTRADLALRRLASPALGERRAGVRMLVGLLPEVRRRVIDALPTASWTVQVHLIEVLARDGSEAAVQALLEHLIRAESTQAMIIRDHLARDPKASAALLATWRRDPPGFLRRAGTDGDAPARLAALIHLCRRAEIEAIFLSRKSKTGSTGYYDGQYDLLQGVGREADFRSQALEIATGIALDEAVPTEGLFRTGVYRFVRPHHVDEWELKSMALHAAAELCTQEDKEVIARLEVRLVELMGERADLFDRMQEAYTGRWSDKGFQDALTAWDDALAEYLDQLACLYQIEPLRYRLFVERFLSELDGYGAPFAPLDPEGYIAGLLIRVGWYDRAIQAFQRSMRRGSPAISYYNMACAAASASKKVGLSASRRDRYLNTGLVYLSMAVEGGWSDIEWMNEDRDLEPLRKRRGSGYALLIARIEEQLPPDESPPAPKKRAPGK